MSKMFIKLEMPPTHAFNSISPAAEVADKGGVKTIKAITPVTLALEAVPEVNNTNKTHENTSQKNSEQAKHSNHQIHSGPGHERDLDASHVVRLKKDMIPNDVQDATLPATSKWKSAKKAKVIGKMALQKKEILNKNYGIDESTADKMEKEEKIKCILPDNIYIIYWKNFLMLLTFYLVFVYVYRVCLLSFTKDFLFHFEIFMQVYLLVDVVLNFFLAYYEQDDLVTDLRSIMIHYLYTFFIFDLISAIPVNLMTLAIEYKPGDESHRVLRLLSASRIVKFLIDTITYEGWKDIPFLAKRSPTIIRLVKILVLLIYLVHFSACIFVLLAKIDGSSNTWIFANSGQDLPSLDLYVYAVHWSTQTIVTVGFGDVLIITNPERFMALVLMYIGSAVYSFMISNLAAVVEEADTFETTLKAKINSFKKLAKETNLPDEIVEKVKKFIESNHKHNPRASMNDQSFINELPFTLKAQLLFNINAKVIQSVTFLKDKDVDLILKMAPNLKPIELLPKEILFRENEYPEDVFFLTSGIIHLKAKTGATLSMVAQSEMFGDLEVLENIPRITTAQAQSRCSLFSIEKEIFHEILNNYPSIRESLAREAKDRKKRLIELKNRSKHDITPSNITTGNHLRTHFMSAADYANRMYEKPTDKFEKEISVYLEKGVGKKWKMKYVKRNTKRFSRDKSITIANESDDKEGESGEKTEQMQKGQEETPNETVDTQSNPTTIKGDTTVEEGFSVSEIEIIQKKKKELEEQLNEKSENLGEDIVATVDKIEECNNNIRTQEVKYQRLLKLIEAIEEKQNQINNHVEMYIKKLELSGKTTTRSASLNSNINCRSSH